ncbi:LuxR C-terminal-related transcriptional regulator [Pseudomonas sp. J452]|uniref:LuxR C-terminal-related transcriptional regulator n=1 Tax=Pseudomonas sp. J452 TaxID=2898441 RepID=UPI0021ADB0B4|nr:LuxR C-terminal-related transcriptional regulator [Pseudomonas sp. J452]UUY08307.1 LuxR C-terminal-related transcriptional regulator [Pseudomonas sp. J452]
MAPGSRPATRAADLPRLPPVHLPRTRLRDALLQADCRLRLLCAPAGSGKSVLLGECALQCPADARLVHLDLRGQAIGAATFLQRLGDALGLPFADAESIDQHLQELQQPLWLMLDDYPRFPDAALDQALNQLILEAPARVLWWVASRRRPKVQLARLLLDGELFELGSAELAFSEAEVSELLQLLGHQWPRPQARQLLEQTRGWCAGLRLRLLGCKPGQGLQAEAGIGLQLDYLKREVLDELPSDWQLALFTLAQFPSFDRELCEQLLGVGEGMQLLAQLRDCGLFIETVAADERLLRVQPTLAPLLAGQLPGSMSKALFRKACQWYASREEIRPALEYALKADQQEVAASLMQHYTEDRLLRGRDLALLLEWCRELPPALRSSTPRLALLNAWALLLSGHLDEGELYIAALERFLPQPSASRQQELIAQWKALSGKLAFHRGDAERARTLVAEASVELPERAWSQRLLCHLLQIEQALIDGDLEQAQVLNRAATKQAREHASLAFESLMALEHAKLLEIRGELLRAESLLSRLHTELSQAWGEEPSPMRGRGQLLRAGLLLQRGSYQEAEAVFKAGVQECQVCADPAAVWGLLGLAELDALHGDSAGAFARIADVERLMQYGHINAQLYQGLLLATRARLWLAQGRHAQAEKALRALLAGLPALPPFGAPELNVRLRLLLAQAQLASGEVGEALDSLTTMHAQALAEGRRPLTCEIGFSLAEGLYAWNKPAQAKQALLDALAMARQMGLASVERAFSQRSPALMRWAGKAGSAGEESEPAALLSRRELDVLRLIAQGLSNQQIAESLFISLHTVKTHAQRINFKLGVERRTQAVVRAKELGLTD